MGVTERRAREREALSEAILDAASELIVKKGPGSLSIRKIAEKIEYAPSTIYLYFEDKHAILAGICIRFFEDLLEELNEIRDNTPDPREALRAGLRCYVDFGLANPTRYQVTFLTAPAPDLSRSTRFTLPSPRPDSPPWAVWVRPSEPLCGLVSSNPATRN